MAKHYTLVLFFSLFTHFCLAETVVTIDPATTYQTIQDFGASDCWMADYLGRYFSEAERVKAARWLFSQQLKADGSPEGIGLSCWRVNIGAGSATQGADSNISDETRRTECFLNADGTYDWTRQQGQQWFMQQAKQYGVDHFLLFSNSAPIYYTANGKANANNQSISCNLQSTNFSKFAEFLATVTEHFTQEGYNVTYIDPVNEPQFDWRDGQEGSPWTNSDIASLVKQLDKSLQAKTLQTKILLPEAAKLTCLYGGNEKRGNRQAEAFFNPTSAYYVGNLPTVAPILAGHSYWTFGNNNDLKTVRQRVNDEAAKWGVAAMQTEWSLLDAPPSTDTGFPASYEAASKMDIALFMGKLIQCDLVFGNMVGWHYWTAFSTQRYSQKNRFYLLRVNAKGDTGEESYGDIKQGGTISQDKNLWVLGQFSRFIRPDYKRVSLSGAESMNGLMGSAYLSPDGNQVVAVFVNTAKSAETISLQLADASRTVSKVSKYTTNATWNMQSDQNTPQTGSIPIPARAVVTLVLTLSGTDDLKPAHQSNTSAAVYSLNGTSIATPALHGIYIQNHKKFVKHINN